MLKKIGVWYVPTGVIWAGTEALLATDSDGMVSMSHNLHWLQK